MSAPVLAPGIVGEINAAHERCRAAAGVALEHAMTAGRLLIEAKAAVPHGEWGAWLKQHCVFSERLAQTYMQLARELPKANPQRVADLSIREAVKLLAEPQAPNPKPHEQLQELCAEIDRLRASFLDDVERDLDALCDSLETPAEKLDAVVHLDAALLPSWLRLSDTKRRARVLADEVSAQLEARFELPGGSLVSMPPEHLKRTVNRLLTAVMRRKRELEGASA